MQLPIFPGTTKSRNDDEEACNEIALAGGESFMWRMQSGGGSYQVTDPSFRGLQQNLIDRVSFGRENTITLKLNGKGVVPASLRPDQRFGSEIQALSDENSNIVGKFIGLVDNDRQTGRFPDPTAPYKKRDRILLAALYVSLDLETVPMIVPCVYISGDLNLKALEAGKCQWVDSASRASNGKPYCW